MRTLWIAGLGAVLITGGASAQGMNTTPGSSMAPMNERALERSPANEADDIRRAQNPQQPARGEDTQRATGQRPISPMNERALERSPANEADDIRRAQNPQRQSRLPAQRATRSDDSATSGRTATRRNAPRDEASRAYMGGGMILENGRPVPLPGDPPGMGSDFRGERVGQSTAGGGMSGGTDQGPQTNVGQTGTGDQGAVGTSQGAFSANPQTPGGRVPTN